MAERDIFLELRETLEKDLQATGFSPDREPPGSDPVMPKGVKDLPNEELKSLYDQYLSFFEYVSDQLAQASSYASISKARLEQVAAEATLSSAKDKSLSNAELRKAYVTKACVGAKRDYVYFKAQVDVHEARLRKISKSMDRLGRELWFRAQDENSQVGEFTKKRTKPIKRFSGGFKPVSRESRGE